MICVKLQNSPISLLKEKPKVIWQPFCIQKQGDDFPWSLFPCPNGTQEERFVLNASHQSVWSDTEELRSQMENNCWEFNTSTEKVMLVERGKHFAKLARAASAPSAAGVCPAGIYQRHTEADSDPILPDAWRGREGEMWRGAVPLAGEADTAQRSPRCESRGGGRGTLWLPSSTTLRPAEEAWGARLRWQALRRRRLTRTDGMSPATLKTHADGGNLLLLLGGGHVGQSREDCLSCIRDGASTTSPMFVWKLAQNKV